MNPKYAKYDQFPSNKNKIRFDLNEIETSLRRQKTASKCKKLDVLFWGVMAGLLIVSILHFVVEPMLIPAAHAETLQNDYYCSHLGEYALGDRMKEIITYCDSLTK